MAVQAADAERAASGSLATTSLAVPSVQQGEEEQQQISKLQAQLASKEEEHQLEMASKEEEHRLKMASKEEEHRVEVTKMQYAFERQLTALQQALPSYLWVSFL